MAKETIDEARMEKFKRDPAPASRGFVMTLVKSTADAIVEAFQGQSKRIRELEARIVALEGKPALKYCGVHRDGKHYVAGSAVTRAGGLWVAKVDTDHTPGDSADWQLGVKRGAA